MKILRISNVLILMAAVFFGVLLFWTSQAVQQKEDTLAALQKQLTSETEAIRVLSLEWDYLNRPQRLEELASGQLGMKRSTAKELVAHASDIPEPVVPAVDTQILMEENITHAVALDTAPVESKIIPVKKPEVVSPSRAEKNSFEQLIQSLDAQQGGM